MLRRSLAFALLFSAATARAEDPLVARIDAALVKSTRLLVSMQGPDGGWHSEAYGAFREGHTLSPVVLSFLIFSPESLPSVYSRGVDFVAALKVDPALDYPVYSLSGSILVLSLPQNARHLAARASMIVALRSRQLVAANGWSASDPEYGGWGYFHGIPRKRSGPFDEILGSNITSTLFAVGALQLGGVPRDDPAFAAARSFVERCQNYPSGDGGFFFSPTALIGNKAGARRSYGTATADGFRALLRLGYSRDDPRVRAAASWLIRSFDATRVPGEYPPDREVQRASAYHYWTWTVAHALYLYPEAYASPSTAAWPRVLAEALLARQAPDGSWKNRAVDLREDDPLVATPLAASALAICRAALTGVFKHGTN